MKKLKWWQWAIGGFVGISILGAIAGDPEPSKTALDTERLEPANAEFRKLSGDDVFAMTFDAKTDPDELPKLVRDQCGSREFCKVLGWTDAEYAARGFPMTDREAEAQILSYSINRSTGFEELLWDCELFGRLEKVACQNRNPE